MRAVRGQCSLENFIKGRLNTNRVLQIYHASGDDFEASMQCMLDGPTLASIITVLKNRFEQ